MSKRGTSRRKTEQALPPIGVDTPPREIPLPSVHRHSLLPIYAVGSVKLEKLCRDVLPHAHPQIQRRALKRDSGQEQFGVDVEGFNADQVPEVVISCKCYEEVKPWYLVPWTREFTKHLDGHWKGKGVKVFILAFTRPGNSDELNEAIRACHDLLAPHGIRFEPWDTLTMTDLLRKEVELVDRYFHEAWVKAISPKPLVANEVSQEPKVSTTAQSVAITVLAQEIAALAGQCDALAGQQLETATKEYQAGRAGPLVTCLDGLQKNAGGWARLDAAVRARALRARAMLALNADDLVAAGKLLDEADATAAASDRSARAWYIRATEDVAKAKLHLADPVTAREAEVLAALHLETRDAAAALAVLDKTEGPVSPEQKRLRALAQCVMGDRAGAVATAVEACSGAAPSLAAVHTRAILDIMAALAPGAEVQLGAVPNPISTGLVRVTPDAVAHLDAAIGVLDRQIPIVDRGHANDLELWKLAGLLLHPTRTRDARLFADELLARAVVDPLTVAWCHSSGLRLRYARIRKAFLEALENGVGTPSHVIVLALMEAERSSDSAAAALIAEQRPQFADGDGFLLAWQKRFEGDPGSDAFAIAVHQAERKSYGSLIAFLTSEACSANQLLTGASLLAQRTEWAAINGLRDKIVAVGTPRAIDLAARAALESGDSAGAIGILDGAKDVFPGRRLTESLIYLRARAHDEEGNKGAAITDLKAVAKGSRNPAIRHQLLNSLIGIGQIEEARRHAQSYVKLPSARPAELAMLADVFKTVDAELSRSIVRTLADHPELPQDVVPGVMMLASGLGLDEIEDRMMGLVVTAAKSGSAPGVMCFKNPEEALEFAKQRGEALEQEYGGWRAGMTPGHFVFDAHSFGALYLADPLDRNDALNKLLPMLLRAANAEARTIDGGAAGGKPGLIVDVSALLLAMRCGLINKIEQRYDIQVPESAPLALLAIEDGYQHYSPDRIAAAKIWLTNPSTAVVTQATLPEAAVPLGTGRMPFEYVGERVAAVCRAAVDAGELAAETAAPFMAGSAEGSGIEPLAAVALEPWIVLRLAEDGLLEPIARSTPTYITAAARADLVDFVERAARHNAMRGQVTALRQLVAARLAKSCWRTLPRQPASMDGKRAGLAPQTRSLLEIIDAVNAGSEASLWIEDRAVSRTRQAKLVNLLDVADDLLRHRVIDDAGHRGLDRALRRMGYAFMGVPVEAIAKDVKAARIVGGKVVETPALTAWRCWYAQEVDRLALINQAPEFDTEGRIAGEPRHLLEVMATARGVLQEIWSDGSASDDDKRARSSWAWTCLRFETPPAARAAVTTAEANRSLMATVLGHTANLPLLALLGTEGLPEAARQPFVNWFFGAVIRGRCAVDPELADCLVQHMAQILRPERVRAGDVNAQELQHYLRMAAGRYLELIPEEWRERILAEPGLASELGMVTAMTLEAGNVAIPSGVIEGGIAEAAGRATVDKPAATILRLQDDAPATLTVHRERSGALAAEITAGSQTVHLDPFLVAVTLPDEQARLSAMQAIPAPLDLTVAELNTTLQEIAAPVTLEDRVHRQKQAFEADLVRRLDRVTGQLRQQRSLEVADLDLPAPETVAQFVRLSDPYRAEPGNWLEEMTAGLVADHGKQAAARRLGAVPFELPESFILSLAVEIPADDRLSSAAQVRLYVKASAQAGGSGARRQELIGVMLDRLDRQTSIVASLLRKGACQLSRSKPWRRLHPDIAFALLWVWADRLASSIASADIDFEQTAEIITAYEPADITPLFRADLDWRRLYRYSLEIDATQIAAAFLVSVMPLVAVKELPAELSARVMSKLGSEANAVWYPKLPTTFPRPVDRSMWISTDPIATIMATGAAPVSKHFSERDPDAYLRALMAETVASANPFLVAGLLLVTDLQYLSAATLHELVAYLDKLFVDFPAVDDAPARYAQTIRAAGLGALAMTEEFDNSLDRLARIYAAKHRQQKTGYSFGGSKYGIHNDLTHLIEVIIAYARLSPDMPAAKVSRVAEAAANISKIWGGALQGLIAFLERLIDMVDADLANSIWPHLIRIRQAG